MGRNRTSKHHKKLKKYLERDEYEKFKSYIKKHEVDIERVTFEDGDTLLHIACFLGQEHTVR